MKFDQIKLPSNKKFGFFFSFVFLIISIYFFYSINYIVGNLFLIIGLFFLIVTLLNAKLLLPLNKLWMRFGVLLGMIVSPIILGIIFFGLFTPYSLVMKAMGRDALSLNKKNKKSYWIMKSLENSKINFKQQF